MKDFETRIKEFNELIAKSKRIVFFGGAGVSTDSGIPDFRSKDGLYNQNDVQFDSFTPEYLLSYSCLDVHPDVFFEFYRQKLDCRNIEPNITHKVLADMEAAGRLDCVITQNIDGLHQKAGSKKVYEIHGTTYANFCQDCFEEYDVNFIFDSKDKIPVCPKCGGTVRPQVTLYEEMLPPDAWTKANSHIGAADLIIVGGTSLAVYPAANLVQCAPCPIVVINKGDLVNHLDAALVFNEGLAEVFSRIQY